MAISINIKKLSDQASKALFSLLSKSTSLNIPLGQQCELVDRMMVPILLHGSEAWGFGNNEVIEKVQQKFCKYILNLRDHQPIVWCMVS